MSSVELSMVVIVVWHKRVGSVPGVSTIAPDAATSECSFSARFCAVAAGGVPPLSAAVLERHGRGTVGLPPLSQVPGFIWNVVVLSYVRISARAGDTDLCRFPILLNSAIALQPAVLQLC